MADFPGAIYSPREKLNKTGVTYDPTKKTITYAEDVVKLDDEVVAIEITLGEDPQGAYDTVDERIAALEGGGTVYKKYVCLLSQTGTDAPVATVLENDLGFTPVWTYSQAGEYHLTSSEGFTSNKTTCIYSQPTQIPGEGTEVFMVTSRQLSSSTIALYIWDPVPASIGNVPWDAGLLLTHFEVRVYP